MHMHSPAPLPATSAPFRFVPAALFSCTFPAPAVRVQSAICCGCDLANCLQEKQKAKTIQLSPNNLTTASTTTRCRLWPGAIYIARHYASSTRLSCLSIPLLLQRLLRRLWPSSTTSCLLCDHALPPLHSLFAAQRLSVVQIVC